MPACVEKDPFGSVVNAEALCITAPHNFACSPFRIGVTLTAFSAGRRYCTVMARGLLFCTAIGSG